MKEILRMIIEKVTWSNGNIYEGDYKNDKREGHGKFVYAKGIVYDGNWKDNKYVGH
jgi:hypothetical protein